MKRTLMIVLLATVFALLFTQVALADDVTITHDMLGTEVTINQGDSVTYEFYWYAGTPGLVREFIRCASVTVEITQGSTSLFFAGPPETEANWGPIERATPEFIASMFIRASEHAKTPVSLAYWRMALPTEELAAGDYVLFWTLGWSHRTIDLGDWDGDGRIDHYLPDVMGGPIYLHIVAP